MEVTGFPTSCDIYLELEGKKVAVVQSYTAKATKTSQVVEAFGESEPVATINGQNKYVLELTRLYATDEAISDGIDFFALANFSLVICKPDRKVIYSGCQWSAIQEEGKVGARYLSGLMLTPYLGWTLGTLLGATVTGFLPFAIRSALGIAIYGMFISIIIPPARKMKSIAIVILISVAISCLFYWTPVLNQLSNGWVIIICAVVASAFAAWKFPIKEDKES